MKQILSILIMAALFASCSKQEETVTLPADMQPLTISVTDGGYTDSNPRTRSVENGYLTEFTAGDQIGLYVVKSDGSYAHKNIALTLTDNGGGTLTWQAPQGINLYYEGATAGLKYFTYYPYQQNVNGTPDPTATTAAGFFADVVAQWTIDTDQSTHALYTVQDLMTGSGTLGSKLPDGTYPLSFTMTHAMALVVVETPTTKYTFTNSPTIPDYYIPAPNTKFYGFTPYSPSVGTYRLLVKPAQSGATDLTGSYTGANGNTKEYAIAQNSITAANYVHSKVDGGSATVITKTHNLQAGDFYLKDGSLLGKDENPTNAQKAACIGIVYWVGDITGDDPLLKRDKPGCTHGLVVALQDAGNNSLWNSDNEDVTVEWLAKQGTTYGITSLKEQNKMQGYANTQALMDYNTKSSNVQNNPNLKVLPIEAITTTYASAHPAPASSSGWYFPSVMELKYMCWGQGNSSGTAGRDFLNAQLGKVSGTSLQSSLYWSSSEGDGFWAWCLNFISSHLGSHYKYSNSYGVRAVAAF